jgi:hypothetical protein
VPIEEEDLDRLLKALLARREKWDEPPELGVVYQSATGVYRLAPWNIRPQVWEAGHPASFLNYFAQCLIADTPENRSAALNQNIPEGGKPQGIYFRVEMWTPPPGESEELRKRRMAGGSTPRIKDIPGSRETRFIQATTFDQMERAAVQHRETPQSSPSEYTILDGPVPAALISIVTALAPENEEPS